MNTMRTKTLAGWLALAVLAGCEPMVDEAGNPLSEEEELAASSSELTTNQYLDETFNGTGKKFAPTPAGWVSAVTAAGSEKVAYATAYWNGDERRYVGLVNRLAKGDPDPTWNPAKPGKEVMLNDVMLASDVAPSSIVYHGGNLFVAGWVDAAAGYRGFVAKLDSKGNLVDAFDDDGVIKPSPKNWIQYRINQVLVDDAGRLITIGVGINAASKGRTAIARYNATTGAQDMTFGSYDDDDNPDNDAYKGWVVFEGGTSRAGIGKGRNDIVVSANDYVVRLTSAGKVDPNFTKYPNNDVLDIAVDAKNRVYVLNHTKVIALESSGKLETDFGEGGWAWLMSDEDAFPDEPQDSLPHFWGNRIEYNEALRRIYVGGTATIDGKRYFGTYGFLPNGSFDFTFGGGRVYTDFGGVTEESVFDMALQGEKIILAGLGDPDSHGPMARLQPPSGTIMAPCHWDDDGDSSCEKNHKCVTSDEPLPRSYCKFSPDLPF